MPTQLSGPSSQDRIRSPYPQGNTSITGLQAPIPTHCHPFWPPHSGTIKHISTSVSVFLHTRWDEKFWTPITERTSELRSIIRRVLYQQHLDFFFFLIFKKIRRRVILKERSKSLVCWSNLLPEFIRALWIQVLLKDLEMLQLSAYLQKSEAR